MLAGDCQTFCTTRHPYICSDKPSTWPSMVAKPDGVVYEDIPVDQWRKDILRWDAAGWTAVHMSFADFAVGVGGEGNVKVNGQESGIEDASLREMQKDRAFCGMQKVRWDQAGFV